MLREGDDGWELTSIGPADRWSVPSSEIPGSEWALERQPDGQFVLWPAKWPNDGSVPPRDTVIGRVPIAVDRAALLLLAGESTDAPTLWVRYGDGSEPVADPVEWAIRRLGERERGGLWSAKDPMVIKVAAMARQAGTVVAAEAGLAPMIRDEHVLGARVIGGAPTEYVVGGRAGLLLALIDVVTADDLVARQMLSSAMVEVLSVVLDAPLPVDRAESELIRLAGWLRGLLASARITPVPAIYDRLMDRIDVVVRSGLFGIDRLDLSVPQAFLVHADVPRIIEQSVVDGVVVAGIPRIELGATEQFWRVLMEGFARVGAVAQAWGGSVEAEWAALWVHFVRLSEGIVSGNVAAVDVWGALEDTHARLAGLVVVGDNRGFAVPSNGWRRVARGFEHAGAMLELTIDGDNARVGWLDVASEATLEPWQLLRTPNGWVMASTHASTRVGFVSLDVLGSLDGEFGRLPEKMIYREPAVTARLIGVDRRGDPVGWVLRVMAEWYPGVRVSRDDSRLTAIARRVAEGEEQDVAGLVVGVARGITGEVAVGVPSVSGLLEPVALSGGWGVAAQVVRAALGEDGQSVLAAQGVAMGDRVAAGLPGPVVRSRVVGVAGLVLGELRDAVWGGRLGLDEAGRARLMGVVDVGVPLEDGRTEWVRLASAPAVVAPIPAELGSAAHGLVRRLAVMFSDGEEHERELIAAFGVDVLGLVWQEIVRRARWTMPDGSDVVGEEAWRAARGETVLSTKTVGQRASWVLEAVIVVLRNRSVWDQLVWRQLTKEVSVTVDSLTARRVVSAAWRDGHGDSRVPAVQSLVGKLAEMLADNKQHERQLNAVAGVDVIGRVWEEVVRRARWRNPDGSYVVGEHALEAASREPVTGQRAEWMLQAVVAVLLGKREWAQLAWDRPGQRFRLDIGDFGRLDRDLFLVWCDVVEAGWPAGLGAAVRSAIALVAGAVAGATEMWGALTNKHQFRVVALSAGEALGRAERDGVTREQAWPEAGAAAGSTGWRVDRRRAEWLLAGVVAVLSAQQGWDVLPWGSAGDVRVPFSDGSTMHWSVRRGLAVVHAARVEPVVDGFQSWWKRVVDLLEGLTTAIVSLGSSELSANVAGELSRVQDDLLALQSEIVNGHRPQVASSLSDLQTRLSKEASYVVVTAKTVLPRAGWRLLNGDGFAHDDVKIEISPPDRLRQRVIRGLGDRGKGPADSDSWELRWAGDRLEMWPPERDAVLRSLLGLDPQVDLGAAAQLRDDSDRDQGPWMPVTVGQQLVDRLTDWHAWAWLALTAAAPNLFFLWDDPPVIELAKVVRRVSEATARDVALNMARRLYANVGLGGAAPQREYSQWPSQPDAGPSRLPLAQAGLGGDAPNSGDAGRNAW